MKKAIIYARVSSTTDRQSTDRQLVSLKDYAKKNDIDIVEVFSEKISGGKKNEEREVLNACFDYATKNDIDIILVSELSRLGRKIWEVLESVKYCADNHINVYFQKENLSILKDNGSVDGIMAIYISCLGFCAEMERENIKFRLNDGRKRAIEKGVKMGRKVGSVKTKEQKKEEYKEVIMYLKKGYSVENTVTVCNSRGIKCSISTVKRIKKEFVAC